VAPLPNMRVCQVRSLTGASLSHHAPVRDPFFSRVAPSWVCRLASIKLNPNLVSPNTFSTADDRIDWQPKGLPSDDLGAESAVFLKHSTVPAVIDLAGQATYQILQEYKSGKNRRRRFPRRGAPQGFGERVTIRRSPARSGRGTRTLPQPGSRWGNQAHRRLSSFDSEINTSTSPHPLPCSSQHAILHQYSSRFCAAQG